MLVLQDYEIAGHGKCKRFSGRAEGRSREPGDTGRQRCHVGLQLYLWSTGNQP